MGIDHRREEEDSFQEGRFLSQKHRRKASGHGKTIGLEKSHTQY